MPRRPAPLSRAHGGPRVREDPEQDVGKGIRRLLRDVVADAVELRRGHGLRGDRAERRACEVAATGADGCDGDR